MSKLKPNLILSPLARILHHLSKGHHRIRVALLQAILPLDRFTTVQGEDGDGNRGLDSIIANSKSASSEENTPRYPEGCAIKLSIITNNDNNYYE